jgi:hypothetical protein
VMNEAMGYEVTITNITNPCHFICGVQPCNVLSLWKRGGDPTKYLLNTVGRGLMSWQVYRI